MLRRKRQIGERGISSSLIMRLSVDTAKAASRHSRLEIPRDKPRPDKPRASTFDSAGQQISSKHEHEASRLDYLAINGKKSHYRSRRPTTSQICFNDLHRPSLVLARYTFVAKMLSGRGNVAEVGCSNSLGTHLVSEEVPDLTVYDGDSGFIADFQLYPSAKAIKKQIHDIVDARLPRKHDGLFSLDLIERILPEHEHAYLANLCGSLAPEGVLIIGTPSTDPLVSGSPPSMDRPLNCKSGKQLKILLDKYFAQVFLFSMRDEAVHAGIYPMAHYSFVVCTGPK